MSLKNFMSYEDATTIFGEYADKVNELKSGLTNVDNAATLNTQDLTTASRTQNISPITLSVIKSNNTDGTWADNVYTLNDATFTVSTDSDGNVDGITVNGTASDTTVLTLYELPSFFTVGKQYVISGCYSGGAAETYKHDLLRSDAVLTTEYGSGVTVTANSTYVNTNVRERIVIYSGVSLTNAVFLPMVRLANTSTTYAPYIPSVERRIEAVESGLTNLLTAPKVQVIGIMQGNILTVINNLDNGVAFFPVSNSPTNYPSGHEWGSYIVFKADDYADIIYIDSTVIATAYRLVYSTAQSITWKLVNLA